MLKKIFFQIHWFLGITAGLILSIVGVTGAIYSYDQQILKWLNPESYQVSVPEQAKLTPNEIFLHFQRTQPEMQINSISIEKDPAASSSINIVKEGARRGQTLMINPYSAELLPELKGRDFFQFIMQLHRWLTIGDVGKQIVGASTLMLIFFVLSGLYLRWPKRHSIKQWFAVKPKLKGRNFIWDLHAVIGTWVAILYLIMAITGLYWSYDWWRAGMFKVMGVEAPKSQSAPAPKQPAANNAPANQAAQQSAQESAPSSMQISHALNISWTQINRQLGRDYSSMTLNLPKKADDLMEISFVDAPAQHERARNSLKFDYQHQKIEELKLYQDKKLNEKIMSSMLPVHRGSFFGPVVQFLFMLGSLIMPLFFVTGWMLYLKRRKQKKLTLAAKQQNDLVLSNQSNTQNTWLICYASQTGLAEQLAWCTARSLQQAQQHPQVVALHKLSANDLMQAHKVLFVVSTFGTGEAPDLATVFEKKVMKLQLDLSQLNFAVLALGSKEYPESYCAFGHRLYSWLQKQAAQPLFEVVEVDNNNEEDIQRWNSALSKQTHTDLASMHIQQDFEEYRLVQRDLLNPQSLGTPAFHLELEVSDQCQWQAGDIAEVRAMNSQAEIDVFLAKHHLDGDTLVPSKHQKLSHYLANQNLRRSLTAFDSIEGLISQLTPLATREYSIANINNRQRMKLVVRQMIDSHGHLGLGSGWLTQHAALYSLISVRIRSNPSFHLIADDRPIICIGNGSGIAGLMSLVEARIAKGCTENWLIFGERQRAHDYFFQNTLEQWQSEGHLAHLDMAFSRDQAEKFYVHHILRAKSEQLKAWLKLGAVLYVCGSAQSMAIDVEQALLDILGEDELDQLRVEQRYRRDVY